MAGKNLRQVRLRDVNRLGKRAQSQIALTQELQKLGTEAVGWRLSHTEKLESDRDSERHHVHPRKRHRQEFELPCHSRAVVKSRARTTISDDWPHAPFLRSAVKRLSVAPLRGA